MSNIEITPRISTNRQSSVKGKRAGTYEQVMLKLYSKAMPDQFTTLYATDGTGYNILPPPINPRVLYKLVSDNSYLQQCIQAMVVNTVGFGYSLHFHGDPSNTDIKENSKEAILESQSLEDLLSTPNPFYTYQELLRRFMEDKETTANAYLECVKDTKGRVVQLFHLPAISMRITRIDKEPVIIDTLVRRGGKEVSLKTKKYFRRYVQLKSDGVTKVYFKEFGDPRIIDPRTGHENKLLSAEEAATEVIHYADYNPNSVYGVPKWYSQLPSILGSREAELTNLDFFENNAIPAMAVIVGGGLLTQDTVDLLSNGLQGIKGRGSMNNVAIIEASPNLDAASASGAVPTPSIKLEPLYASRQQDATFLDYTASCAQNIMSSFRLPPVYIAGSKDYTYASAQKSVEVAETQTFIPSRRLLDDLWNATIIKSWNVKYWEYKTNNCTISTPTDIISAVKEFTSNGAITPNIATGILNRVLNLDIPEVDTVYGNIPSTLLTSILRGAGGEDKTNLIINALKILSTKTTEELKPIMVQTPGNSDNIIDPVNDPKDAPKHNSQGTRNDLKQ